jgi:hypothetical protein
VLDFFAGSFFSCVFEMGAMLGEKLARGFLTPGDKSNRIKIS